MVDVVGGRKELCPILVKTIWPIPAAFVFDLLKQIDVNIPFIPGQIPMVPPKQGHRRSQNISSCSILSAMLFFFCPLILGFWVVSRFLYWWTDLFVFVRSLPNKAFSKSVLKQYHELNEVEGTDLGSLCVLPLKVKEFYIKQQQNTL